MKYNVYLKFKEIPGKPRSVMSLAPRSEDRDTTANMVGCVKECIKNVRISLNRTYFDEMGETKMDNLELRILDVPTFYVYNENILIGEFSANENFTGVVIVKGVEK